VCAERVEGMGERVGEEWARGGSFITVKYMYNNDVGKGGVRVSLSREVK
jgi:hypothetical protein